MMQHLPAIYILIRFFVIAGIVLALDMVTKQMALSTIFATGQPVQVTPFLNFAPVWNEGVSFGLFRLSADNKYGCAGICAICHRLADYRIDRIRLGSANWCRINLWRGQTEILLTDSGSTKLLISLMCMLPVCTGRHLILQMPRFLSG